MAQTCKRRRIFVVDPDDLITSTLVEILSNSGFDALPFTDPVEALHTARLQAPDLLVSAVIMPQLSGTDLAIQVQEICPDCKVLLWSAVPDAADLLEVARSKGHDFPLLAKPVHPTDLLKKIQDVLGCDAPPHTVPAVCAVH